MHAEPELMAEVQTTALMMDGRTEIPADWKAMTKGDCAAVPVDIDVSFLLSYGLIWCQQGINNWIVGIRATYTIRPTIKILRK